MSSNYSYKGITVEIDDFAISFKQLRTDIYSYVEKNFPGLGEITYSDYLQKWDAACNHTLNITAGFFIENSVLDYTREVIEPEIKSIFFSSIEPVIKRIDRDNRKKNDSNRSAGTGRNNLDMNTGPAAVAGTGIRFTSSRNTQNSEFMREKDNIIAAFNACKQKVSVFITKIMAAKMLDDKYLDGLDEKTNSMLEELSGYQGDSQREYDELVAGVLSVNPIDWYVYEKIFRISRKKLYIDPFEIEKIAQTQNFDVSDLIIDYFRNSAERINISGKSGEHEASDEYITNVAELLKPENEEVLFSRLFEESRMYTNEQKGVYADFIADINEMAMSLRSIVKEIINAFGSSDFDDHMHSSETVRGIHIKASIPIRADNSLNKRLSDAVNEILMVYNDVRKTIIEIFHVTIVQTVINDNSETPLERDIHISDCLNTIPDRSEEQIGLYNQFRNSVCARALNEWTETVQNSEHDELTALYARYKSGEELFYNTAHNYISTETYEQLLVNKINDIENKALFRMTLGMNEKSQEELEALRKEIKELNYNPKIIDNFVKKINQTLYEKVHVRLMSEIENKVAQMSYEEVTGNYGQGNNVTFSVYQPDEYISSDDINGILLRKVNEYEKKYLEEMCTGIDSMDLGSSEALLEKVRAASYREENKIHFCGIIEQRIIFCQEKKMREICSGMERMGYKALLCIAEELMKAPYDHLELKKVLSGELNGYIRKELSGSMNAVSSVLASCGFLTAPGSGGNYIEFERSVMSGIPLNRDVSLVETAGQNNVLGSREVIIGVISKERMLGLAEKLTIVLTNRNIYISGNPLIPYGCIKEITEVKKLLARKIEIVLNQGNVISFGYSKEEITKVCSALQYILQIFR